MVSTVFIFCKCLKPGTMSLLGQVMLYFSSYGLEFVDNIVGDRLGLLTNLKDEYNKVKRKQKTVMKKLQK